MSKKKFILTKENYFSKEANENYLNVSTSKNIMECESKARAVIDGRFTVDSEAFAMGGFLHAWWESPEALEEYKIEHPEVYDSKKKDKQVLKVAYKRAYDVMRFLEKDPEVMRAREGLKEQIYTGVIDGVPFRIRVDNINVNDGYFTDLKFMKSVRDKFWNKSKQKYVNFIEHYNYLLQVAVYQEIIRQNVGILLQPLIMAVGKEGLGTGGKVSDKELITFKDQSELDKVLADFKKQLPHIRRVWQGAEKDLDRCGVCDYCKSTRMIEAPIDWKELVI